jgi:hypothetical protein
VQVLLHHQTAGESHKLLDLCLVSLPRAASGRLVAIISECPPAGVGRIETARSPQLLGAYRCERCKTRDMADYVHPLFRHKSSKKRAMADYERLSGPGSRRESDIPRLCIGLWTKWGGYWHADHSTR